MGPLRLIRIVSMNQFYIAEVNRTLVFNDSTLWKLPRSANVLLHHANSFDGHPALVQVNLSHLPFALLVIARDHLNYVTPADPKLRLLHLKELQMRG